MRVLFIGDIFGSTGRRVLAERLQALREEQRVDMCIANGENSAGGVGITYNTYRKLRKYGVDVVTGGNHSLLRIAGEPKLLEVTDLLRPHNMPPGNPGIGTTVFRLDDGRAVAVMSLQGRTYFREVMDCPFRCGRQTAAELRKITPVVIVDFHAEATSEKGALGRYLDGRVSAVLGTHTHVGTTDARIFPRGTAFVSDIGMTGPVNSIIGDDVQQVLQRFLTRLPHRLSVGDGPVAFNAIMLDIDDDTGRARHIERIYRETG